nr:hypothetical protein [Nocardioides panacis]
MHISAIVAGGDHPLVTHRQEPRVAREVLERAPHLAGRRHRTGVEGRLAGQRAGVVVHAEARRVRRLREVRRPGHAERCEDPLPDHVEPGGAAVPADHLAEQRERDVRVVEGRARRERRVDLGQAGRELVERAAGRALPPGAGRFGVHAGVVGEQAAQRPVAVPDARQVHVEPVVEVEHALVAQLQDRHRHQGLGDRADAVLHVGPGRDPVHAADRAGPHELAVADDAPDHRRQPAVVLLARQEHVEPPGGEVADRAHASTCEFSKASGDGQEQTRLRSP